MPKISQIGKYLLKLQLTKSEVFLRHSVYKLENGLHRPASTWMPTPPRRHAVSVPWTSRI